MRKILYQEFKCRNFSNSKTKYILAEAGFRIAFLLINLIHYFLTLE